MLDVTDVPAVDVGCGGQLAQGQPGRFEGRPPELSMLPTCLACSLHVMPKTLQIRDVPDDLHATLRARAAHAGQSVSDYLLDLLRELAARPTMAEIVRRAEALARAGDGATRADVRAALRAGRDR